MTDKLHCPFCGAELTGYQYESYRRWCSNVDCEGSMTAAPEKIWQALIDGKKAQDALKEIDKYITDIVLSVAQRDDTGLLLAQRIREDGLNASKKIASITKQENE